MDFEKTNTKTSKITDKTHKLHKSKRSGLKSVFAINDKIVVTTFGKKEEGYVILESDAKRAEGVFSKSQTFNAIQIEKPKEVKFVAKNNDFFLSTNPFEARNQKIGQDYLGVKDKLEMAFWGKTYPNDNIHVQIAYNLLDVKKILGLKVGNAIFTLNNLQRGMIDIDGETVDYIGQIKYDTNYDEFDERRIRSVGMLLDKLVDNEENNNGKYILKRYIDNISYYQQYFEGLFKKPEKEKGKDGKPHVNSLKMEKYYKEGFLTLQIVSFFRQENAHANTGITGLFNPNITDETKEFVNVCFSDEINRFKTKFEINSKKVMYFLCKFYGVPLDNQQEINKLAQKYFEYVLWKDDKNLGVNLVKLKELIFEDVLKEKDKENPSELSKINALMSYYIYDRFSGEDSHLTESIISQLRECGGDEEAKENIYCNVAKEFIKNHQDAIDKAYDLNNEFNAFNKANKGDKNAKAIEVNFSVSLDDFYDIPVLHKMLYVLTNLLDEKDSNDVMTSLINKFENIVSLIKVASDNRYKAWDDFIEGDKKDNEPKSQSIWDLAYENFGFSDYLLNNDLNEMIRYFRLVKNLAAMKTKLKKADISETGKVNEVLFADAINMFRSDKFLQIKKDKDKKYIDERFEKYMELFKTEGPGKKTRNLIINSIIKNRRFSYIVKYYDPTKCHKILEHENIVRFLLSREDMQDSIIFRYYKLIINPNISGKTREQCIDALVGQIKNVSIDFPEVNGRLVMNKLFDGEVKNKELISLCLTLMYIFVKGMVRTNSVFLLALSAFGRDSAFFDIQIKKEQSDEKNYEGWLGLVHKFTEDERFKYKNKKYINTNEQELLEVFKTKNRINSAFRFHRDKIAHLNYCFEFSKYLDNKMVIKSYYDVYAYVVEKMVIDYFKKYNFEIVMPNGEKLETLLDKYYSHNIDFFKLINLPFAYNMARYKNLTISDLFNDRYPVKSAKGNLDHKQN